MVLYSALLSLNGPTLFRCVAYASRNSIDQGL